MKSSFLPPFLPHFPLKQKFLFPPSLHYSSTSHLNHPISFHFLCSIQIFIVIYNVPFFPIKISEYFFPMQIFLELTPNNWEWFLKFGAKQDISFCPNWNTWLLHLNFFLSFLFFLLSLFYWLCYSLVDSLRPFKTMCYLTGIRIDWNFNKVTQDGSKSCIDDKIKKTY